MIFRWAQRRKPIIGLFGIWDKLNDGVLPSLVG